MEEQNFADDTSKFHSDLVPDSASNLSEDELKAVASLPTGSALLIVTRGADAGARYLLDKDETLAGRHPDAEVFLDDVTVSRRHAEFIRTGQLFSVRDLGSMNGTYLNGKSISESTLASGDEVRVGKFRLTFYAPAHEVGK